MVDIVVTDVVHTIEEEDHIGGEARKRTITSLVFGDGALTYPAGGVPLDSGSLGFPANILYGILVDESSSDGFMYKYDKLNNKVRIYQGDNDNAADAPLIELVSGVATPAATTLRLMAEGH